MTSKHEGGIESTKLITQLETQTISQEQLIAIVKNTYVELVEAESKCMEVVNSLSSQSETQPDNEQWEALIDLHMTLLHKHHSFFVASQHPSANQALRRLPLKYGMPGRMWRHGIHSLLELLRHRLPHSLGNMRKFINLTSSKMQLYYRKVPAFENIWMECLGDLGRYRMAIEDHDIQAKGVWTSVSRKWYLKASDKVPTEGRLYHHLAVLARPNLLQQLYYYTKSLCVPKPFSSSRKSIMTLFDPILNPKGAQHSLSIAIDVAFVKAHGILYSNKLSSEFGLTVDTFCKMLENHIGRTTTSRRRVESGYCIAISNCCGLLSYGQDDSVILKAIRPQHTEETTKATTELGKATSKSKPNRTEGALKLFEGTSGVVLRRLGDPNTLPYLHVVMVFIFHLSRYSGAMSFIEGTFPWKLVSLQLNALLLSYREHHRIQDEGFPRQEKEPAPRPLPEDFAMKGLLWVDKYYPLDWFSNDKIDDDEKYFEVASMTDHRKERILWLGCRIAKSGRWLTYDELSHQFGVVSDYEKEIDNLPIYEEDDGQDIDSTAGIAGFEGRRGEGNLTLKEATILQSILWRGTGNSDNSDDSDGSTVIPTPGSDEDEDDG